MKPIKLVSFILLIVANVGCQNTVQEKAQNSALQEQTKVSSMPKVSVQLYSVRDSLKKDFIGTLKEIASFGFEGVEFAGVFGPYENDPQGLKKLLDELGLKVSGAHVSFKHFTEEKFNRTVEFYRALEAPMLIVPWDDRSIDPDKIDEFAKDLTELSKKLSAYGMKTGYHNHDDEFAEFKDSTYWDYLARSTPSDVVLQLDVGWAIYAGKDPVSYVKRYPGRTLTTHYKAKLPKGASDKLPLIGQDAIDWESLIQSNIAVGGTQWLVVEQEDYPNGLSPLESVRVSKRGLDLILQKMKLK
ncbi:sugar phosphate isomerase/epimerase family protein [Aliikangiella coralliicola]|uniref:Sugar phosphate isomerase/epimerase n=1 Tax=Aliikangiella coralliicola TaxID=2592383 RepID=A0A545U4G4_9GAMM|nr:sugar phosphate isomerase/epimerase [Aliikangiella coralliicola]TQV84365.1 sugar phosphate isomerase/epimerase [Aliikangiella coralliicola]